MLNLFAEKNVSSAKATHIFSAKNIRILYIESAKTINEMTLNELVKLTTLWTTGPWVLKHLKNVREPQREKTYLLTCTRRRLKSACASAQSEWPWPSKMRLVKFWSVRISLSAHAVVQSDSLHCPNEEVLGILDHQIALSEDSDQTARMRRLICIFTGRRCAKARFLAHTIQSKNVSCGQRRPISNWAFSVSATAVLRGSWQLIWVRWENVGTPASALQQATFNF